MKTKRILILLASMLFISASAVAGTLEKNAFDGIDNKGAVRDRCLNNFLRVTMKKLDKDLYFVRVKNLYVGQVKAGSYGEARDIACNKKNQPILYNSEQ